MQDTRGDWRKDDTVLHRRVPAPRHGFSTPCAYAGTNPNYKPPSPLPSTPAPLTRSSPSRVPYGQYSSSSV